MMLISFILLKVHAKPIQTSQSKMNISGTQSWREKELQAVKEPNFKCRSEHKISRMCINPKCKTALTCSEGLCSLCRHNTHSGCPSISLEGIIYLINSRVLANGNFLDQITEIDEKLAQQLEKNKMMLDGLKDSLSREKWDLFGNKSALHLTGKKATLFYDKLQNLIGSLLSEEAISELLDRYSKFMTDTIKQMSRFNSDIFLQFSNSKNSAQPCEPEPQELKDSLILNTQSQRNLILQALQDPYKVTLLFRASQHKFQAKAFHQACDGVESTLTIVHTEFGKIIAGFKKYPTNRNLNQEQIPSQGQTFLYSISLRRKMVPIFSCQSKQPKKVTFSLPKLGPVFGQDLMITDRCDQQRSSFAYFPTNYDVPGRYLFTRNQDSFKAFSGATNGDNFKVLEYEVYEVHYRKSDD